MELTVTEKRVLAVVLVCGRVNRIELNAACNTDSIYASSRETAIDNLRMKGIIPQSALRRR